MARSHSLQRRADFRPQFQDPLLAQPAAFVCVRCRRGGFRDGREALALGKAVDDALRGLRRTDDNDT